MSEQLTALMHANLLEVFGERDPAARRRAIERTYTPDVAFADPDGVVTGYDALDAKAQHLLDGAPGFVFQAAGPVAEAQEMGYLAWTFGPDGGEPVARGADMGFVRDGRIERIYTILLP